jgi:acylphosphatase
MMLAFRFVGQQGMQGVMEMVMDTDVKGHLRISGRVQGVGYRYFTQEAAIRLGLRGYVRNLGNGDVEVVVEGSRSLIDRFIAYLRRGPVLARVDDIAITWKEAAGELRGFSIRPSSD